MRVIATDCIALHTRLQLQLPAALRLTMILYLGVHVWGCRTLTLCAWCMRSCAGRQTTR